MCTGHVQTGEIWNAVTQAQAWSVPMPWQDVKASAGLAVKPSNAAFFMSQEQPGPNIACHVENPLNLLFTPRVRRSC